MIVDLKSIFMSLTAYGLTVAMMATSAAAKPIDAGTYTTYQISPNHTKITWTTCGIIQNVGDGCFSAGTLSSFTRVCAMLESEPVYGGQLVARQLYVLDIGQTTGASVTLWIYRKTDTISNTDATVFKLEQSINLPLTAGKAVSCFMAANPAAIFAGTNASGNVAEIWRSGTKFTVNGSMISRPAWTVDSISGNTAGPYVSSITANNRGYVSVSMGGDSVLYAQFLLYGPNGYIVEDGGNSSNVIVPNTLNAVIDN